MKPRKAGQEEVEDEFENLILARKHHEESESMKRKLHEYRIIKLKKTLEEEKQKKWIYYGNEFRPQ